MRIAELDRKITIKQRTGTRAASGQMVYTFSDVATVWSKKTEIGGSEGVIADQMVGTTTTAYIIRYRAGIKQDMIILDGDDKEAIIAVNETVFNDRFYRKRFLTLRTTRADNEPKHQF